MKRLRVGLIGANGKMGLDLEEALQAVPTLELSARVTREKSLTSIPLADLKADQIDGVIDFSSPQNLPEVLKWCVQNNKPLVVGTTGFIQSPEKDLSRAADHIPVLWSPNMSLGIAYVQQAIRHFALIQDFDFQIEEIHHTQKRDAPSGTGLFLQKELQSAIGRTPPDVLSIRAGKIFGIHRVMAFGPDETIVLEHQALNRRVFSNGALKALQWLVQQKNGFYALSDLFSS